MVKDDGLEKWVALEERVRAIKGNNLYDPMKATEMCLVPNIVIPKKFRVPEFVNLSEVALTWYMHLDNTKETGWKDLVDAFVGQYKFNMDIALDRSCFHTLEKGRKESVREYAQRWHEMEAQVNPPLLEKEMISLFSNTFKAPYFEYLVRSFAQNFSNLVAIIERIE
ncbi:PREDICTED: uncharacterized protein LOC105118304 [Populus euphratica]|uniref:Uncharacterized protein LOC105118304 n=1 Tax=Populus euphratica TaxID=75702 RepID=A0AAJ6TP54_POPEU|nr:PREDICTED: uncharacterized protein LOC105118304 [Populus euphratica]